MELTITKYPNRKFFIHKARQIIKAEMPERVQTALQGGYVNLALIEDIIKSGVKVTVKERFDAWIKQDEQDITADVLFKIYARRKQQVFNRLDREEMHQQILVTG